MCIQDKYSMQKVLKFVNLSYLAAAVLVAYLTFLGVMKVSSLFDLESKIKPIEYLILLESKSKHIKSYLFYR